MGNDTVRASLELLYSISRELASSLDLSTVLNRVLYLSIENVGAERGAIIVLDDQQVPVEAAIVYGGQWVDVEVEDLKPTIDQGLAGWAIKHRLPVLVSDTSQDERWLRRPDDAVEQSGAKSAICVPLLAKDNLAGVLTMVHSTPGTFDDSHLALLQAIADQAGIAIYNAHLYDSLATATRRYRELFEDSIDSILITNLQGQVVEANRQAAQVTGFSDLELAGQSVMHLHEANFKSLGEGFELIGEQGAISYESRLRKKSGETLPVQVFVRRVQFETGAFLQWTLHDISERKALDALQEDLMAMIYHDLRAPLGNIFSSLDMLSSLLPLEQNATLRSIYLITMRSTERLQRLINSLLDISRLEAGQAITNQQVASVSELIRDAAETVLPAIESKRQTLEYELSDEALAIWVDTDMIRRVFINLLENAAKFSPPEGQIVLGARREEKEVHIWVADSGPGIPAEAHELIFDKFTRVHGDRYPKGVGLGLAFCRLAVQAHGGRIWVESRPSKGSRFILTLPAAVSE
jgi:PAS domain S-box-containing protein